MELLYGDLLGCLVLIPDPFIQTDNDNINKIVRLFWICENTTLNCFVYQFSYL